MATKFFPLLVFLLIPFLTSCEDKELVEQHSRQSREILALRAEYAGIKDQLDKFPPRNQSANLEETERMIVERKKKISDLEKKLKETKADQKAAEEAFADYKKKFPLE